MAMRLLGEQFVIGQTIEEALANSRKMEARGFRHSYDMLGEAAMTDADARRYLAGYEHAIGAIGRSANRRGVMDGAGHLDQAVGAASALLPRAARAGDGRSCCRACARSRCRPGSYDIGLTIDAEECDRLELSLDLFEALCADPGLAGWDGLGFAVQAYQKRAIFVHRAPDRPRTPKRPSADGPARERRLLGHRDQARAGGRA